MPTIQGEQIGRLVNLFERRGVKYYHACQLRDFKTYLKLGGIPSRHLMETSKLQYTPFETDRKDKQNNVWDKVFGNITDFGYWFANKQGASTPNPYGPILFKMNPKVFLEEAKDVAVCLRSAGGLNFKREDEALPNVEEIERIFEGPGRFVKFSSNLKEEFKDEVKYKDYKKMEPEISCIVTNEKFSFNQVETIIVDHYEINDKLLHKVVMDNALKLGIKFTVYERYYGDGRKSISKELGTILIESVPTLEQLTKNVKLKNDIREWAQKMLSVENMSFHYNRFANYLRVGTILEMIGQ